MSCSKSTTKEYVYSLKFGPTEITLFGDSSWFQIIKVKISIQAIQFGRCFCVNVIRKSNLDTGEQMCSARSRSVLRSTRCYMDFQE